MRLTSKDARTILEEAKKNPINCGWVKHCICVGETARRIAKALNSDDMSIDEDKILAMGYIHDIGKVGGLYNNHVLDGYYYIKSLGYDDEFANVCMTHSYLNNDVDCTAGGYQEDIPFRTNFIKNHNYTIYDKIINICDLMCTQEVMSIEERLIDLFERKGFHPNSAYHVEEVYKLKNYFDGLLGYDLYDVFPEIKKTGKNISDNYNKVLKYARHN